MAGEWIPVDINLDEKPETQELIDLTGETVEVVTYRLRKLWGWASLNSDDGTVRTTPARLGRMWGSNERFWLAVETVGWLSFDAVAGTASIPGWGRRFSQSAKARALHLDRAGRARAECANGAPKRSKSARDECAGAQQKRTREEERTVSSSSSPVVDVQADGATLRAAWNAAARAHPARLKPHGADDLPEATLERLRTPGWLQEALRAIARLHECRYFTTPVNLAQFSGAKAGGQTFARKVLEQQFDNPKQAQAGGGFRRSDDPPPAVGFQGAELEAFERTRQAMLRKVQEATT